MSEKIDRIGFELLVGCAIATSFFVGIIAFILYYSSKRAVREEFKSKLFSAQLELQEQTAELISSEIHDNVGQILSVAHIYLQGMKQDQNVIKTKQLISSAISSLRNLSHNLNASNILQNGIASALENESEQIQESGIIKVNFGNNIGVLEIPIQEEVILFRICQEVLNNAIKHSNGDQIDVNLTENDGNYFITIIDNGTGFDFELENSRAGKQGLKNMKKRSELIGVGLTFESQINMGTKVNFKIKKLHV